MAKRTPPSNPQRPRRGGVAEQRTPGAKRTPSKRTRKSVLLIGGEALPFSKTGGLADVLGALPPALARLGWDVTVATPRYRGVSAGAEVERFTVTVGGYTRDAALFEAPLADGARAILVDCPELYDRESLYNVNNIDYADNARRYAFLVRAALEFAGRRDAGPTVVHAHDWQAGLAPVYLRTLYASHPILGGTPSVFTIHNLAYQGLFEPDWLPRLDLGWELFTMAQLEFWGRISFLKGGINHAAFVTTVSRTYAQEIQTPAFGFGFDGILRARAGRLVGILNGIDTGAWDPATDPHLPNRFSAGALDAKRASKRALLVRYGLPADDGAMARPLIGMISRMVDQKGFDLVAGIRDRIGTLDAGLVVLGTGEERYQKLFVDLAHLYPERIAVRIGFDDGLAHLIEAGADMFLMPSQWEPCGLNQMYSLRYGTVPVVRAVGGLADTVKDWTPRAKNATGFAFRDYTADALFATLERAIAVYRDAATWRTLQRAGMAQDNSWDRSAREYVKIYERAARERP